MAKKYPIVDLNDHQEDDDDSALDLVLLLPTMMLSQKISELMINTTETTIKGKIYLGFAVDVDVLKKAMETVPMADHSARRNNDGVIWRKGQV